jgi:hypothetical protein
VKAIRVPKLVVHLGPAKVFSTSIQDALAKNREALLKHGVYVPLASGGSPGHHIPIIRELIGEGSYRAHAELSLDTLSFSQVTREFGESRSGTLLLSSERFITPTHDHLTRLLNSIEPEKTLLVMGVRPPLTWFGSWYSQKIKGGTSPVSALSQRESLAYFIGVYLRHYLTTFQRLLEADSSIQLSTFSLSRGSDLGSVFSKASELPIVLGEVGHLNERAKLCELRVLHHINRATDSLDVSINMKAHISQATRPIVSSRFAAHECSDDCGTRLETQEEDAFLMEFAKWVTAIQELAKFTNFDLSTLMSDRNPLTLPFELHQDDAEPATSVLAETISTLFAERGIGV